jgi:hypothetical protein
MPISYALVYAYSSTVAAGDVISQDPVADPDNPFDPNLDTVITLTISLGSSAPKHSYITERSKTGVLSFA